MCNISVDHSSLSALLLLEILGVLKILLNARARSQHILKIKVEAVSDGSDATQRKMGVLIVLEVNKMRLFFPDHVWQLLIIAPFLLTCDV